jgi:hypothetical protein
MSPAGNGDLLVCYESLALFLNRHSAVHLRTTPNSVVQSTLIGHPPEPASDGIQNRYATLPALTFSLDAFGEAGVLRGLAFQTVHPEKASITP